MSDLKVGNRVSWFKSILCLQKHKGIILAIHGKKAFVDFDKDKKDQKGTVVWLEDCKKLVKKQYVPKVGDRVVMKENSPYQLTVAGKKATVISVYEDGIQARFDDITGLTGYNVFEVEPKYLKKLRKKKHCYMYGKDVHDAIEAVKKSGVLACKKEDVQFFEAAFNFMENYSHDETEKWTDELVKMMKKKESQSKFKVGEIVLIGERKANILSYQVDNYYAINFIDNGDVLPYVAESYITKVDEKKKELKLEVGKFYRTESNYKIYVYFKSPDKDRFYGVSIHEVTNRAYTKTGQLTCSSGYEDNIIAEWED